MVISSESFGLCKEKKKKYSLIAIISCRLLNRIYTKPSIHGLARLDMDMTSHK